MENPATTVRWATVDDVPLIRDFIRGLAIYEDLLHQFEATDERLRETLFGDNPPAEVLIAESGGEPAGFALFFTTYSTFLAQPGMFLEDLFVKPEMRGSGIGKALLRRVAREAVERGCGRLEWRALDWNEAALGFYRKLGATVLDDWLTLRVEGDGLGALASNDLIA